MKSNLIWFMFLMLMGAVFVSQAQDQPKESRSDDKIKQANLKVLQDMEAQKDLVKRVEIYHKAVREGVPLHINIKNQVIFPKTARSFAEANDKKQFEYWLNQITIPNDHKINFMQFFIKHGEYDYVFNSLVKQVDSLNQFFTTYKDNTQLIEVKGRYDKLMPNYAEAAVRLKKFEEAVNALKPLYHIGKSTFMTNSLYHNYGDALTGVGKHKEALKVFTSFYMDGEDRTTEIERKIKSLIAKIEDGENFHKHLVDSIQVLTKGVFAKMLNSKVNMNGDKITPEQLKGKYILLDFWGSWCAPCRGSHPELIETYNKYKNSGFEIISIATEYGELESAKKIWKAAVAQDKLPWLQILDEEHKSVFSAAYAYKIYGYPTKILLDRNGDVVARYMGASQDLSALLTKTLAEHLGDQSTRQTLRYKDQIDAITAKFNNSDKLNEKAEMLNDLFSPLIKLEGMALSAMSAL